MLVIFVKYVRIRKSLQVGYKMVLEIVILILCILIAGLVTWIAAAKFYQNRILTLQVENLELKARTGFNENVLNEVKVAFSKIAQDSLKMQQEHMLSQHSADLNRKIELFKSEEINPINKLLKEFKDSIESYHKAHALESLEIKNAISTAEKYAKALTTNQNLKGEFGEEWLEQILKFANLEENVHYTKQFVSDGVKPDFLIKLPEDKHLIIDSKVILKNFIEYKQSDDDSIKKVFISDLNTCVSTLAKKNYEDIPNTNQPGFILMYIPIEACVNLIYTDYDFRGVIENANSKNIIIVGSSSLLVTLRLVNQLWASRICYDNVQNIIKVGESLYNNIAVHSQRLLNIQQTIENASESIQTEINRFKLKNNGSIFKDAEKLKEFGIESKNIKSGRKLCENSIQSEFLEDTDTVESAKRGV